MSESGSSTGTTPTTHPGPYPLTPGQPPPPPLPPIWPGPSVVAGPAPLLAAVVAGVLAAALVPLGRPGLGWSLAGLAVTAAVVATLLLTRSRYADTAHRPARPGWRAPARPERTGAAAWAAAALLLLTVGAVRSAGWVFLLCLLAAVAATVAALTSGRTVRGLALAGLLMPAAVVRGAAWAWRGTAAVRRTRPAWRPGRTAAVTGLVLLVFGTLLTSADAAFSRLLHQVIPPLDAASLGRWSVLFVLGAGGVLAAVFLRLAPPSLDPDPHARGAGDLVRPAEWMVPVATLVTLFGGFVAVQVTVLFGGASYVLGPDGPTYAEYARSGFWQLLVVTILTLMVIAVVARIAPRHTATQRWWLRGLLGALAVLSLVIVASALLRMHTYQEAYGFTRLRVLVSVAELWLGLVFLLVLVAGVRLRARWWARAVLATGIAAVLALSALNPDRFIAERNLARWAEGHHLDVRYLAGLSADAAPVLVCLPDQHRDLVLARLRTDLDDRPDDWRSANLARAAARDLLADPGAADCPPW
jgi:hypothetical protein